VVTLYGTGFGDGAIGPIAVNIGGQAAALLSVSPVDEIPGAMRLLVRVPFNAATGDAAVEVLAGAESAQSGPTIVIQ